MAGLLTYSGFELPSHFIETVAFEYSKHKSELTAAGTVVDFHDIPFSFRL